MTTPYVDCHTCIVLSLLAEAIRVPSGDHATAVARRLPSGDQAIVYTQFELVLKVAMGLPLIASHRQMVLLPQAKAMRSP